MNLDIGPRHRPGGAIFRLTLCLFLGGIIECFQPRLTPPGNIWSLGDTLATATAVFGAGWASKQYYHPWLFLVYGMLCGILIGFVFLPDSRDMIAIGMGIASPQRFFDQLPPLRALLRFCMSHSR